MLPFIVAMFIFGTSIIGIYVICIEFQQWQTNIMWSIQVRSFYDLFFYHIQTEYRGLQSKFPCLFWIQENKDEIALQTQTPSTQFSVSRSLCTYIKHCHFCIWLFYMSKTIFFRILPGSPSTIYLVLFWACLLRQYLVYLYIIFPCIFFWWIKKT